MRPESLHTDPDPGWSSWARPGSVVSSLKARAPRVESVLLKRKLLRKAHEIAADPSLLSTADAGRQPLLRLASRFVPAITSCADPTSAEQPAGAQPPADAREHPARDPTACTAAVAEPLHAAPAAGKVSMQQLRSLVKGSKAFQNELRGLEDEGASEIVNGARRDSLGVMQRPAEWLDDGGLFAINMVRETFEKEVRPHEWVYSKLTVHVLWSHGAKQMDALMAAAWVAKKGGFSFQFSGPHDGHKCVWTQAGPVTWYVAAAAKKAGTYSLMPMIGGKLMPSFEPLRMSITRGTTYVPHTKVSGLGLFAATIGKTSHIAWETWDQYMNKNRYGGDAFVFEVSGPVHVECDMTDHQDGSYSAWWRPTRNGEYIVTIQLGNEHLIGSPWVVQVFSAEPAYAPYCELYDIKLKQSYFISEKINFKIRTADRYVPSQPPSATTHGHPTGIALVLSSNLVETLHTFL